MKNKIYVVLVIHLEILMEYEKYEFINTFFLKYSVYNLLYSYRPVRVSTGCGIVAVRFFHEVKRLTTEKTRSSDKIRRNLTCKQ